MIPQSISRDHILAAMARVTRDGVPPRRAARDYCLVHAGSHYPHPTVKGIRRIRLHVTRHHVYYLAGTKALLVLAVWGSVKGAGPNLNDIE